MYKRVKVKTVWGKGLVTVNSKYVNQALKNKQGLIIECKGAEMKIPYAKLTAAVPRGQVYTDKYGRGTYKLYDFFWEGGVFDDDAKNKNKDQ